MPIFLHSIEETWSLNAHGHVNLSSGQPVSYDSRVLRACKHKQEYTRKYLEIGDE